MNTRRQGQAAETRARHYLEARGLRLLARNWHCRQGELDLVMLHDDTVVFIEVRYRQQDSHGSGAESVNWRKRQRLCRCALRYLQCHPQLAHRPARLDVVSMAGSPGDGDIQWIRAAFDCL